MFRVLPGLADSALPSRGLEGARSPVSVALTTATVSRIFLFLTSTVICLHFFWTIHSNLSP